MFNPLNNPIVLKTVLSKAQEELNESLKFRKKQFDNKLLYMWVEIDNADNLAYVCLKNEKGETLVRMTVEELLEDKDIKNQLIKIPAMIRPFINYKKIVPEMNQKLLRELGHDKFLKITEGSKKAKIDMFDWNKIIHSNVDLYFLFG